jgi:hypothetical protein
MPGETVPLKEHLAALRECDQDFADERDRRYTEVNIEREKALKIKEEADKAALGLAREIQTYKDEKANELREQINSERGLYVTKTELEPIKVYIAGQTGQARGVDGVRTAITFAAGLIVAGLGVYAATKGLR